MASCVDRAGVQHLSHRAPGVGEGDQHGPPAHRRGVEPGGVPRGDTVTGWVGPAVPARRWARLASAAMTRPAGSATRRRLIDEAVRHFGKRGFDGTSLDTVASAAGVRKQTLLYYFPTKDALLEACMGEVSTRVAQALS